MLPDALSARIREKGLESTKSPQLTDSPPHAVVSDVQLYQARLRLRKRLEDRDCGSVLKKAVGALERRQRGWACEQCRERFRQRLQA